MLFFNANFICYYFYPTKKREEPLYLLLMRKSAHLNTILEVLRIWALLRFQLIVMRWITVQLRRISVCPVFCP